MTTQRLTRAEIEQLKLDELIYIKLLDKQDDDNSTVYKISHDDNGVIFGKCWLYLVRQELPHDSDEFAALDTETLTSDGVFTNWSNGLKLVLERASV